MDNSTTNNNNSNYDLPPDKTQVGSEQLLKQGKIQAEDTEQKYTPSDEILQKYKTLKEELSKLKMDNCSALLDPFDINSVDFERNIKEAEKCLEDGINMYKEPIEKELEDAKKEQEHWNERMENDKRHLDSLLKAKKETDVSSLVNEEKCRIVPLFDSLTKDFRELAKTNDSKTLQETYTKVLLYIQNKPLDEKDVCDYCTKTNNAYYYIRKQFAKEDKWVKILDDQMVVSKLHTKDKHKDMVLDGADYKDIAKTVKELHSLYFTFENNLVFSADENQKVFKCVKFGEKVIDLNILAEKPLLQKPDQK